MPSKAEDEARDYCAGIASEVSSSFPPAARDSPGMAEGEGGDQWRAAGEADLELGLSLGAAKTVAGAGKAGGGGGAPWREYCGIRTARDFSLMVASRGSPISSSSSSASSCPSPGRGDGGGETGRSGVGGVAGNKRAADPVSPPEMRYRLPRLEGGFFLLLLA